MWAMTNTNELIGAQALNYTKVEKKIWTAKNRVLNMILLTLQSLSILCKKFIETIKLLKWSEKNSLTANNSIVFSFQFLIEPPNRSTFHLWNVKSSTVFINCHEYICTHFLWTCFNRIYFQSRLKCYICSVLFNNTYNNCLRSN